MAVLDQGFPDALYGSTKSLATVGPNTAVQKGPGWFKLAMVATMLLTLLSAACFTGGLIDRLTSTPADRPRRAQRGAAARPRRGRRPRPGRLPPLHAAARVRHPGRGRRGRPGGRVGRPRAAGQAAGRDRPRRRPRRAAQALARPRPRAGGGHAGRPHQRRGGDDRPLAHRRPARGAAGRRRRGRAGDRLAVPDRARDRRPPRRRGADRRAGARRRRATPWWPSTASRGSWPS